RVRRSAGPPRFPSLPGECGWQSRAPRRGWVHQLGRIRQAARSFRRRGRRLSGDCHRGHVRWSQLPPDVTETTKCTAPWPPVRGTTGPIPPCTGPVLLLSARLPHHKPTACTSSLPSPFALQFAFNADDLVPVDCFQAGDIELLHRHEGAEYSLALLGS